jgi:site-specific DNA recombinase
MCEDIELVPGLPDLLSRQFTINLFEAPQRERIRKEVVQLTAQKCDQREIAARISEKPTQTAVQRALALDRAMRAAALNDPYIPVLEPPADYSKLRRHLNRKYCFRPQENYQRQPL